MKITFPDLLREPRRSLAVIGGRESPGLGTPKLKPQIQVPLGMAFVLALCLIALNGCATLQVTSTWAKEQNAASNENSDSIEPVWTPLDKNNAVVAVSNDSEYLHLKVRFSARDNNWVRSCAMTGLTVWLNANGRKRKDFGITIASGPSREGFSHPVVQDSSLGREEPGFLMQPRLNGGLTVNYADQRVAAPANGALGPSATFAAQSGVCTYDLSVPISGLNESHLGLSAAPGATIMVGLTAGPSADERAGMEQRSQEGQGRSGGDEGSGNRMGGGPPGGEMGGGMGGGPPGGGMGGGPGGGRPGMEEVRNPEVWVKLQLAAGAVPPTRK
jgi:hypothetical protein